jgi:RNA polymerase II subunit A small phosphatase-like protein
MSEVASTSSKRSETRALLILDIDETLIFGSKSELHRPADFLVGPFHIYRRPRLDEFLAGVGQWYDLAIWSSATIDYVGKIADQICPPGKTWRFVWGRDRCTQRMNFDLLEIEYIKDLKKARRLGFDINRILFVDDTAAKLTPNFGNAIYIAPYFGLAEDDELRLLLRYLESIRDVSNFREVEKRGWRNRIARA